MHFLLYEFISLVIPYALSILWILINFFTYLFTYNQNFINNYIFQPVCWLVFLSCIRNVQVNGVKGVPSSDVTSRMAKGFSVFCRLQAVEVAWSAGHNSRKVLYGVLYHIHEYEDFTDYGIWKSAVGKSMI